MYHIYVYVMYVVHIMYKLYNVAHVCVMYSTRIIYYSCVQLNPSWTHLRQTIASSPTSRNQTNKVKTGLI